MPKIAYVSKVKGFTGKSLVLIGQANEIIVEYAAQGYDLTLRQLYYQMVARDIIPNNVKSYSNLGSLVNEARLMGYIDWDAITDRTRNLRKNSHWGSPRDIIQSAAASFRMDRWRLQTVRPEVWVEKDALIGIIADVCEPLDVPYFACRGYTSQSEMWLAAQRLLGHIRDGFTPMVFHLGDHDPSGIDMSRDIEDRLNLFLSYHLEEEDIMPSNWYGVSFERIALNGNQVAFYNPPPNPAKMTDSRALDYVANHGYSSWELDALSPTVISDLITNVIAEVMDQEKWDEAVETEEGHRQELIKAAKEWRRVSRALQDL